MAERGGRSVAVAARAGISRARGYRLLKEGRPEGSRGVGVVWTRCRGCSSRRWFRCWRRVRRSGRWRCSGGWRAMVSMAALQGKESGSRAVLPLGSRESADQMTASLASRVLAGPGRLPGRPSVSVFRTGAQVPRGRDRRCGRSRVRVRPLVPRRGRRCGRGLWRRAPPCSEGCGARRVRGGVRCCRRS